MAAGIIAMPLRAQPPEPTLTLAEYRAELAEAITQLEAVSEKEAGPVIEQLQEHLATLGTVSLASDEQVTPISILGGIDASNDETATERDLDRPYTPREIALARLHGAVAQIDASANDNTAARLAILKEVLARPEFNTPQSLWDRFWQWLENLLDEWLPNSSSMVGAGWLSLLIRLIPWGIAIVVLAVVLWLLSYWLQRILRSFVTDARITTLADDDDMPATAAEARQQAHAAAQSGHYRDAVRRLYLAALLQLAEHDLITYERSLTNREVLVRVPNDSPIRPHLEPVIATFDQVWYGVREPDLATFHAYEQEIDTLAAIAARTAAASPQRGGA